MDISGSYLGDSGHGHKNLSYTAIVVQGTVN